MSAVPYVPSRSRVQLLDPHTINQIAAGEVVERPASVVKELVENALDAGATRIEIVLEDSGKTLIEVRDNGCGMDEEDALNSLKRHATSKIRAAEDLLEVLTLGFRGEAIPSIASVSRFTLSTGVTDGLRTEISVEDGSHTVSYGSGPRGTTIAVRDLFYNTPARLKFLKSAGTELGQCVEVVSRFALSYPDRAFHLSHNGQEVLSTRGSGDMLEAISTVWGRELAKALVPIDASVAGLRLTGYVSPPHITRHTRAYQFLMVNGRMVRTRILTAALDLAYRDLTPEKRYPLVVLNIQADPATLDVNVSPTKSEVKFQHEGSAFEAFRTAIQAALLEHGMMPDMAGILAANQALAEARAQSTPWQRPAWLGPTLEELSLHAQQPLQMSVSLPNSGLETSVVPTLPPSHLPFADLVPGLRVIGQLMNAFILAETHQGLVIIDQHVAHERVLYEYLCGIRGKAALEVQPLLAPIPIELDRRQAILIQDRLDELEAVGFKMDAFGKDGYLLREIPAAIKGKNAEKVVRELIDELLEVSIARKLVPTREQIWITSSCKMAVKAGDPLSLTEMEKLILDLAETENPYLCPHGRPITCTLSSMDLLKLFKRT